MKGYKAIEHKVPAQHIRQFPHATAHSQEDQLYLHVKQYIPISNPNPRPGDVTILGAHANAFPKELYEPLWEDLLDQSRRCGWRIRGIWIADVAHQGQSSVLNESSLGNDPGWHDHPRDLLHLVNLKREEMPRPIVGIGHSMGGNHLTHLSLIHPRLLSSLILMDPVVQQRSAEIDPNSTTPNLSQMSTFRRDLWPSRDFAAKSFSKSPFYKVWDSRVFERWIEYGLRSTPTLLHPDAKNGEVTLTTTPAQEVFTFLRPNFEGYGKDGKPVNRETHPDLNPALGPGQYPFYRSEAPQIYARLPEVRPSVLYIFGQTSGVSTEEMNEEKVARTGVGPGGSGGRAEGRVDGVTFEGVGHLIPMEAVEKTAEAVGTWIGKEAVRWREEAEEWESWRRKELQDKQQISEEWKKMIGGPPKRPAKM